MAPTDRAELVEQILSSFEFAAEVKRTLERILQFSEAWTRLSARTRRCRTKKFPYGLVYQIRSDKILIIAVMHSRRHPDSWKNRTNEND
ncbi:MAG: type II toxin-antitoxin system RelE/ParE family toxin [Actinobacteria bacterium]|nr:type II toxin-antitoxin system RelE/ParE family toxin [Actinomycetota bacterium]